jgi:hypothetical protein
MLLYPQLLFPVRHEIFSLMMQVWAIKLLPILEQKELCISLQLLLLFVGVLNGAMFLLVKAKDISHLWVILLPTERLLLEQVAPNLQTLIPDSFVLGLIIDMEMPVPV